MYTPLGDRLIVRKPTERVTDSGIVLSEQEEAEVLTFEVLYVSENNRRFEGKTIVAERRLVRTFPEKVDGGFIGSIKVEDIIAIKEQ